MDEDGLEVELPGLFVGKSATTSAGRSIVGGLLVRPVVKRRPYGCVSSEGSLAVRTTEGSWRTQPLVDSLAGGGAQPCISVDWSMHAPRYAGHHLPAPWTTQANRMRV